MPRRGPPDADMRSAKAPAVFVGWHFGHPIAAPKRFDDHFLFDGRRVFAQAKLAQDRRADRSEAVLAVTQPHAEFPVEARGDEGAARQPEELVEAAMQLARATDETRPGT